MSPLAPVTWYDRRRRPVRRVWLWLLCPPIALLIAGAALERSPDPFLINETPSLARGLYRHLDGVVPARGRIVAIDQPADAAAYLRRLGVPARMPLLKRVVATGGDPVCADGRRLMIHGRTVPVRSHDRQGRPLPVWRGCRILQAGELILLGDSPLSFDSRHFGPVRRDRILGVYEETLTW